MSTHNLCFERNMKNIRLSLSENFPFLAVMFSVYLNRRVFVMLFGLFFMHSVIKYLVVYCMTNSAV